MGRETDREHLPEAFSFAHDYCLFLYGIVVETLQTADSTGVFAVPYSPRTAEEAEELAALEGEQVWEWFENRGYDDVLREMVWKRIVPAVAADLCLFVHEALSCSSRNKLTVAYALLRKPLRENLLYLEWLLVDPDDFIEAFLSGDPKRISMGGVSAERRRQLVQEAIARTVVTAAYPESFIYDIRYERDAHFGLEVLWNQAIHLVTTRGAIATGEQNLNFVFSDHDSFESQWEHLYKTMPVLLY